MENRIKTRFSLNGLLVFLFAMFPSLIFNAKVLHLSRDIFSLFCVMSLFFLFFSIVLVRNYKEPAVDSKSKMFSLSAVFYGLYFLLMVLFGIHKAGPVTAVVAHLFMFLYLVFFSIDRRNWLSVSASLLSMILFIIRESLILGHVL